MALVIFVTVPYPFETAEALHFFLEHHIREHGAVSAMPEGQVQVALVLEDHDDVTLEAVAADSVAGFLDPYLNKIWASPDWRACVDWDSVCHRRHCAAGSGLRAIATIWDSAP